MTETRNTIDQITKECQSYPLWLFYLHMVSDDGEDMDALACAHNIKQAVLLWQEAYCVEDDELADYRTSYAFHVKDAVVVGQPRIITWHGDMKCHIIAPETIA